MNPKKTKPKCISGTPCGYACISGKKRCSDRVLERDAKALVESATKKGKAKTKAKEADKADIPDVEKETIAAKADAKGVNRSTGGKHSDIPEISIPPSDKVSYTWRTEGGKQLYFRVTQDSITYKKTEESITRAELDRAIASEFDGDKNKAWNGKLTRSVAETDKLMREAEAKQAARVAELTGLSLSEAKASIKSIKLYSEPESYDVQGYGTFRNVERGILKQGGGLDLSEGQVKEAKVNIANINRAITKLPVYEGAVHRGMMFSDGDTRDKFIGSLVGGFSFESMTSFSSAKAQAKTFASKDGLPGLLITVKKNKSGASIKGFSSVPEEDEVLVPATAKYRLVGKPKKVGKMLAVELEEY